MISKIYNLHAIKKILMKGTISYNIKTHFSQTCNLRKKKLSDPSIFVSSYYNLLDNEVESFLKGKNIIFSDKFDKVVLKFCFFCPPNKNLNENLFKLYIWKRNGNFYCHRCLSKGSWYDFLEKSNGNIQISSLMKDNGKNNDTLSTTKSSSNLNKFFKKTQSNLMNNYKGVLDKIIKSRGLTKETLKKYNIGTIEWSFDHEKENKKTSSIIFPWITLDHSGNLIPNRFKIRSLKRKEHQHLYPKGGPWGLFGFNLIPATADSIIITEGEFDAMAVYQKTNKIAVSLPIGCSSLPPTLLPSLERFKKIYLWMDDDIKGQESAEKFAKKLGYARCYIVHSIDSRNSKKLYKDANEALLNKADIEKMLRNAKPYPHKRIITYNDIRSEIFREIKSPKEVRGTQYVTIPSLNRILKGHRSGELSIFTGSTGCGKTTFLSQLSLDLAEQGINTLWGSFEIKPQRLCKLMLNQYSGVNLENNISDFNYYSDNFENIPLYFLRFYGSTIIDRVLDAMEYAVYVFDVKHVILDNLQFMLGCQHWQNKFDLQDAAIEKLRSFATNQNVHITVVIHPRKENDENKLGLSSIFGSAKASQEADNVLVLQKKKDSTERILEIKKNRYSGHIGKINIDFDQKSKLLFEIDNNNRNYKSIYTKKKPNLNNPKFIETKIKIEPEINSFNNHLYLQNYEMVNHQPRINNIRKSKIGQEDLINSRISFPDYITN